MPCPVTVLPAPDTLREVRERRKRATRRQCRRLCLTTNILTGCAGQNCEGELWRPLSVPAHHEASCGLLSVCAITDLLTLEGGRPSRPRLSEVGDCSEAST
ncbi:hypothetical protein OH77DRAFT_1419548 [Trametes cingulata]|nr:hypothetical protein OH77DRAFT_1419548 [Trametes cingulata]